MSETKTLTVPRGKPGVAGLSLDMTLVYEAERRLREVAFATPGTAPALMGYFNEACSTVTKYVAWIDYEILVANKHFDLAKAEVILDKSVDAFAKLKETGIKYNEDFRAAMIARDPECQQALDIKNMLSASRDLLQAKMWSFMRAYNSCKAIFERKTGSAGYPNLGGPEDGGDGGFFGTTKL